MVTAAAAGRIPAEHHQAAPIPITGRLPAHSPTRSRLNLGESGAPSSP
jgi:hypothetical protein